MKKLLIAACAITALTVSALSGASASETDWFLIIQAPQIDPDPSSAIFAGTYTTSIDAFDPDHDSLDTASEPPPGPAGSDYNCRNRFYRPSYEVKTALIDSQSPMIAVGDVRTWTDIQITGGASYYEADFDLKLYASDENPMPSTINGNPVKYTLTLTNAALVQGLGYSGPTSWNITPKTNLTEVQTIKLLNINKPTSDWGWTNNEGAQFCGYFFTFTAEVVPEPGSVMVLASGLAGLAGMILRRRS